MDSTTLQYIARLANVGDPKPINILQEKIRFNKPIEPSHNLVKTIKKKKKKKPKKKQNV